MFENNIVVYKFVQDLHFFVTGGEDENEIILATVLQGFFDAVGLLLRYFAILLISIVFAVLVLLYADIFNSVHLLLLNFASYCSRGNVDKKEALENLDLILLCLDEIADGGYALCSLCT